MKDIINKIDENVKQLKADLGIIPYSDIEQPHKFGNMSMKDVEENINDFIEVIKKEIKERLGLSDVK